ncbi:hypothetical protein HU200_055559 [Digitaria exilis]|uniref:Uncharacterized protein n=1 Tax=Digitaria exilis TaxID=1010633 RepID=A0A835E5R2_9POAL|nr:hypothetical protein HU200_055559 [Digitaria exilis]
MFTEVPPAALVAPPMNIVDPSAPSPRAPLRQSSRLLARPSSVPVSRRATHRLMRQLGVVEQDQAIGNEAVAQYERTYYGPMPRKTVAALAGVTRVASGVVMAASAALAADAEASQVEVN